MQSHPKTAQSPQHTIDRRFCIDPAMQLCLNKLTLYVSSYCYQQEPQQAMEAKARVEKALEIAVSQATLDHCPPRLADSVAYSVFPGGARIRPMLCVAVAMACGDKHPATTDAVASAIELLHCASLVHDDLPCFDDAEIRRGRPTVHRAFGQPLAVLTGDALIILAFETLTNALVDKPHVLAPLLKVLCRSVGMTGGLVAGQAWESEAKVPIEAYQMAKTGSLFLAATAAGAGSAGCDPTQWSEFGALLGRAYQVADDIRDATSSTTEIGKSIGRDKALGRPNATLTLGLHGALQRLESLLEAASQAIPLCPGSAELRAQVLSHARWFVPKAASQFAA